ncbi:MAG: hypothetical protein WBF93_06105, partial [Pirellulales bacterium]
LDAGCGMRGAGCGVRGAGYGVQDVGYGIRDTGDGIQGAGFGVRDTGCGIPRFKALLGNAWDVPFWRSTRLARVRRYRSRTELVPFY